jgi:ribonuclease T1
MQPQFIRYPLSLVMVKNYSQLFIGIVIGLIVGLLIAKKVFIPNTNNIQQPTVQNNQTDNNRYPKNNNNTITQRTDNSNGAIPAKVFTVLQYIKANNHAMDGYVGGRVFTNREGNLPKQDAQSNDIDYQEWDVNEKIQGQNRGTERICTGSDGRSWYTKDHYRTFTEIK